MYDTENKDNANNECEYKAYIKLLIPDFCFQYVFGKTRKKKTDRKTS